MWSQTSAQRAIIVAGCLAMAYTQLTMSPATIEYARSVGGTGLHIGILGALPTGMLFMQFVAAVLANHLQFRRRVWFWTTLLQRLTLLPFAAIPWLFPQTPDPVLIWMLIGLTAVNHAMIHFTTPLWLSWMGDYLPHDGLNRFWGIRHRWMQLAGALSLLSAALYLMWAGKEIRVAFAALVGAGALFGIIDILLFIRVDEPRVTAATDPKLWNVLTAPFRHNDFRAFIAFTCFWHVAAMVAAPFISYYLLSFVGISLFRLMLLWMMSWLGGAFLAQRFGHLAETYGNRPVLVCCTAFKTTNVIALLMIPRDPDLAFWILVPVFTLDSILNAGIAIANNGFMIKNSPTENRTMFIAAGTAVAGLVGGIASIGAGSLLASLEGQTWTFAGRTLYNFHVLFSISLLLRFVAAILALTITEPKSRSTVHVFEQLIGVTPIRVLRYPLGLYLSLRIANGRRRRSKRRAISIRERATIEPETGPTKRRSPDQMNLIAAHLRNVAEREEVE